MQKADETVAFGLPKFLRDSGRLLTFRATAEEMTSYPATHLLWGLLATWLAGVGRTWDDQTVEALRRSGLGSVAYVFVLSLILWLFIKPFAMRFPTYRDFLTFVTMLAPPAFLYAVPVERFTSPAMAAQLNINLLAVVATWRVALVVRYCRRGQEMSGNNTFLSVFTPLSLIVSAFGAFGGLGSLGSLMGGVRTEQPSFQATLAAFGCMVIPFALALTVAYATAVVGQDR